MKQNRILIPVLALSLLCGCAAGAVEPMPGQSAAPSEIPAETSLRSYRVVDGAATGQLLLAGLEDGGIFTADVTTDRHGVESNGEGLGAPPGGPLDWTALKDGMTVQVWDHAEVLETWPAQFVDGVSLHLMDDAVDDRCGLYLQVLEDLWNTDPGLNGDGLSYLGVDLSGLTGLTAGEKAAVSWRFAQLHGLELVTGTFDELVEQGYITGTPMEGTDRLFYEWTDGILFSITTEEEAAGSLPALAEGEEPPALTAFKAQKWRSGLGAYYFNGCSAQRDDAGTWSYTVGAEMIS